MTFENAINWCKKVYLKRVVTYRDPQAYWNRRWGVSLWRDHGPRTDTDYAAILSHVRTIMATHECDSVLEIGCGKNPMRELPGYIPLDFSAVALRASGLKSYICADITDGIPLPDKSVDAVYCRGVLLHISNDRIGKAVREISRVARKCVILGEPTTAFVDTHHCFWHEPQTLFKDYPGRVVFLDDGMGDPGSTVHRSV